MVNTATPEQHATFLEHAKLINKQILAELEIEVPILQNLITTYDPVKLMHRAAYMLLPLFTKYRSENEFTAAESYYLPTVEYLQYLIARTPANADGREPTEPEWEELWTQATKIMNLTQQHLMARGTLTTPPTAIDELRFLLDSKRLGIRVERYPIFFEPYLLSSLSPYDNWIQELYGATVPEIISGLKEIEKYQQHGVLQRYRDVMEAQKAFVEKLQQSGYGIKPDATPEEIAKTQSAFARPEFKTDYDQMMEKLHLAFTPAIFDITDLTCLPKSFLSLLSVKPGESLLLSLTGPAPDYEDLSPLSTSVLHYKPFLEAGGRFYTFYHSGFEDRIAEIVESDLFIKRPGLESESAKGRSDRLEADSCQLLGALLRPDFILRNIFYPNPEQLGHLAELNGLVGVDDLLFLVEGKSGSFSEAASRGASKSLAKELNDLIVEAQQQAERAERYIRSADEVSFYDRTGTKVVHTLRGSDYRHLFRVVVTREQLGWVGAHISLLSVLDPNLSKSFPWHVSLDDLRVVAELFRGNDLRFAHFLEQRLKASAETRLHQGDEIEHIALYNKLNFYHDLPADSMDRMRFDASYMRDIDYYFMDKAAGGCPDPPTQALPNEMTKLISALQESHLPGRFGAASILLSLSHEGRAVAVNGLKYLEEGRANGKQRTLRMPFAGSVGITVTYATGGNWEEEILRSSVQMEISSCTKWVVVQMDSSHPYAVKRIERLWVGRFSESDLAEQRRYLEGTFEQDIRKEKPGRNDQCPCGSGKKYKKCHGR